MPALRHSKKPPTRTRPRRPAFAGTLEGRLSVDAIGTSIEGTETAALHVFRPRRYEAPAHRLGRANVLFRSHYGKRHSWRHVLSAGQSPQPAVALPAFERIQFRLADFFRVKHAAAHQGFPRFDILAIAFTRGRHASDSRRSLRRGYSRQRPWLRRARLPKALRPKDEQCRQAR